MVKLDGVGIRAIEVEDLQVIQTWRNDEKLRRYFREYEFNGPKKRLVQ